MNAETIPVIVGIGEILDRPASPEAGLDPLDLMRRALERADEDAGGGLLPHLDSLAVVNQISWPYVAPSDELVQRLGLAGVRATYGRVGGETPLHFLQDAANAIAEGRSRVAAICGGEAHRTVAQATRAGIELPWVQPSGEPALSVRGQDTADPLAKALGVHLPVTVYPLFENAQAHEWGQSPGAALAETASLWSALSATAASNPGAWDRRLHSPAEILELSNTNRPIAFPYSKLMVANIDVNQGAAILLCSLETARRAGLDDGRLIFIHDAANAFEPSNYLARNGYASNTSRDVVLEAALKWAPERGYDAVELYSCFPCVPKAARRTLGLDAGAEVSVTGGLSFFGAPLNNYMSHAACAMVRRLRGLDGKGLLYGQGGFATKHHVLTLGGKPKDLTGPIGRNLNVEVSKRYGAVPPWRPEATGPAVIETHTVIHGRHDGRYGVVVARTDDGARTLARVSEDDVAGLEVLEELSVSPIGRRGWLVAGEATHARWSFQ